MESQSKVFQVPFKGKMADALEIACEICQKTFTQKQNLKRHFGEIHPEIELPENIKDMKDIKKTCPTCSKQISTSNFQRHLRSCAPKEEQQPPLSSAEQRKIQPEELIDDTYTLDLDLFHRDKPIESMLREFYSKKKLDKNFSRDVMDKYITALKNFERSFARRVKLTPRTLMEGFESRFDDYFDSLQYVSQRNEILHGLQVAFQMLHAMKIISFEPIVSQLKPTTGIIKRYLNSSIRSNYFYRIHTNAADFAQAGDSLTIRNFLLIETVLATKSSEFVHQLTREVYLKGKKVMDGNYQTKWVFQMGPQKSFEIPDLLKTLLHRYLFIIRKHVLTRTHITRDGKTDIWDPHSDDEVKFFAVSEKGKPFQVEITKSAFEVFYLAGKSHKTFHVSDLTENTVEYILPEGTVGSSNAPLSMPQASKTIRPAKTSKRSASTVRETTDKTFDTPANVSPPPPPPPSRKKHLSFKLSTEDKTFLLNIFKDVPKTELSRTVVLSRQLIHEEFEEFLERQKICSNISENDLADEIVRTLKN